MGICHSEILSRSVSGEGCLGYEVTFEFKSRRATITFVKLSQKYRNLVLEKQLEQRFQTVRTSSEYHKACDFAEASLKNLDKWTDIAEAQECPICLAKTQVISLNACGHKFCQSCIKSWFLEYSTSLGSNNLSPWCPVQGSCPVCRKSSCLYICE